MKREKTDPVSKQADPGWRSGGGYMWIQSLESWAGNQKKKTIHLSL